MEGAVRVWAVFMHLMLVHGGALLLVIASQPSLARLPGIRIRLPLKVTSFKRLRFAAFKLMHGKLLDVPVRCDLDW